MRINLSKIDKDHIFTSNTGDKFILASIVHKEKTFEDGENYQGFIQQYWKDETLPPPIPEAAIPRQLQIDGQTAAEAIAGPNART